MANNIKNHETQWQLTKNRLLLIGYFLLTFGMLGRGILQIRLLGVNSGTGNDLLQILNQSGGMAAATTAIVFEAMELCAIPVFAVLTVDGFGRTSNLKKYILRVLAVAIASEIPYNFIFGGAIIDASSRNPVFATVLALSMLGLFRQYGEKNFGNFLIRGLVLFTAFLWVLLFKIEFGGIFLIAVAVLWMFRERPSMKEFLAAAAVLCCCVVNPLVMFAPFGFLITHWYRGEKGFMVRGLQYAMYPLLLVLTGLAGFLVY